MDIRTVEFNDALDMIVKAIAERGSRYVYEVPCGGGVCKYVHGTYDAEGNLLENPDLEPGCIVGLGLILNGYLTVEELAKMPNASIGQFSLRLKDRHGITFTRKALDFLAIVQANQDRKVSWGEALTSAVVELRNSSYDTPLPGVCSIGCLAVKGEMRMTADVITYAVDLDGHRHSTWAVKYESEEEPYRYWVESSIGYKGGSHETYLPAMHEAKGMVDVIRETSPDQKVVVTAW